MVFECDNKKEMHDMLIPKDSRGGLIAYCKRCQRTYYVRKDGQDRPELRRYSKLFYRDIVQPSKPLYYKAHPERMNVL